MTPTANVTGLTFFAPAVKPMLQAFESQARFACQDRRSITTHIGPKEAAFVAARDSFHLAGIGEDGWPYTKHRRGPKGFLRVLDTTTLGFAGLSSGRQNISSGTVLLFLTDHSSQERLKIWAETEISEDPAVLADPTDKYSRSTMELAFLFHIRAFDWIFQ
jgi:hypothetical protein